MADFEAVAAVAGAELRTAACSIITKQSSAKKDCSPPSLESIGKKYS